MSLDERSTLILTHLLHAKSYVQLEEISEKIKVSKRTIYYDLEKINHWLKEQKLDPVQYIRSSGLYLADSTKNKIPEKIKTLHTWQILGNLIRLFS
ncbi:HTH domain-containing protein [Aneurinibacillus terranovensis]|uniref:HTH domain-containing protein n=1 Tax=Aneurinibacillus terranovensis TaxID=278991 RepID=UPI00040A6FF4|nr:HTH domain-containing protein [Aneurinibacillus terranovensis]